MEPMINICMARSLYGADQVNLTALNKEILWGREFKDRINWSFVNALGGTLMKQDIISLRDFLNEVLGENK